MAAKVAFSISSKPPFRDLQGRFVKAERELLMSRKQEMIAEANRFVGLARDEAPSRKGKFKQGITHRTFVQGNAVGFNVSVPMPLGKWIIGGTKPHVIVARRARALRFLWERGPRSSTFFTAYHFYKSVHHPGTKKNPFMGRAFRRWLPGARKALSRISTRYVRTLLGGDTKSMTP